MIINTVTKDSELAGDRVVMWIVIVLHVLDCFNTSVHTPRLIQAGWMGWLTTHHECSYNGMNHDIDIMIVYPSCYIFICICTMKDTHNIEPTWPCNERGTYDNVCQWYNDSHLSSLARILPSNGVITVYGITEQVFKDFRW